MDLPLFLIRNDPPQPFATDLSAILESGQLACDVVDGAPGNHGQHARADARSLLDQLEERGFFAQGLPARFRAVALAFLAPACVFPGEGDQVLELTAFAI